MPSKTLNRLITFFVTVTLLHHSLMSVHDKFSHFQRLTADDFRVRVKRNVHGGMVQKYITLSALGQTFQLHLRPGSPALMDDFKLDIIHENGSESILGLDMEDIYHGQLVGDADSWVSAVYDQGVWTAIIAGSTGTYYIEPLHIHETSAPNIWMIIYKGKDVKPPNATRSRDGRDGDEHPFCRVYRFSGPNGRLQEVGPASADNRENPEEHEKKVLLNEAQTYPSLGASNSDDRPPDGGEVQMESRWRDDVWGGKSKNRPRRSTRSRKRDTCDVLALADFKAFSGIGERSVNTMAKFLIVVYAGVDAIFRSQKFGEFQNIRIQLRNLKVFVSVLTEGTAWRYLRLGHEQITGKGLLESMSKIKFMRQFCISHLTTQRNFSSLLGVACEAGDSRVEWNNGICASTRHSSRNVGLSTVVDAANVLLPLQVYIGIVAHELGHNFGASHDDARNERCAPPSDKGGKYLMWYRRTLASTPNSKVFSPCSRWSINQVLQVRGDRCLKLGHILRRTQCGNARVDQIEECDGGNHVVGANGSTCCRPDCTLAEGAVCSPINNPCCSPNCTVAPPTQKCSATVDERRHCVEQTYCSGSSFAECPLPVAKPEGSACERSGECRNGECVPFCRLQGLKKSPPVVLTACDCDSSPAGMCRRCCSDLNGDRMCRDYGGFYQNGSPCLIGVCYDGVCVDPLSYTAMHYATDDDSGEDGKAASANGLLMVGIFTLFVLGFTAFIFVLKRKLRENEHAQSTGQRESSSAL